ncbi:flagellar biosynthetic protein FliO [Bradyrhizobium sp. 157]|uniref:flagellar biosynthetic protein FliO n=1 Tax=Bradyrhizobium sp. 157 TaxID=2782631 RepID=UPI001FF88E2D|nr:flagellar biosynthetic protein FliO [Bradyrhizobium sp. 157]MCK1642733.1 flagellar biosynthetic protein FliO [Bradyrhizobium sp. 157]
MQTLTFLFAFIAVLALIGVAAWLVRRFANNRLGANTQRGRMPRLAVIDAAAVDGRRRLVLVRRDNVEHLLMIGGPSDIVVEPNIVRAMPNRDQMAPRPAVGEQPPRIAPLPDAAWSEEAARADLRATDGFDHHAEPQMPEPRPARPSFADDLRRPAPPSMPERRSDPLTGFAPESITGRPEAAPPRLTRNEPLMPRPQRELPQRELPKAPPVREAPPLREAASVREAPPGREAPPAREVPAVREAPPVRAPERAAAPPPPPPPPPAPPSADQNLAEMAQRLEAALRRPAEPVAPPVAPETPPARTSRSEPPAPTPAPTPAPQKSGFENLEDEMASLLGRPKNPS